MGKQNTVIIDGEEVPYVAVGNNEIPMDSRDNYEKDYSYSRIND